MNSELGTVFKWLLHVSWQGAVLALIVLAAQWLLQKKLSAGWRYGLWLLVAARLLLPVSPRSVVSVFNLASFERAPMETVMAEPPPASSTPAAFQTASTQVDSAPAPAAFAPAQGETPAPLIALRDLPAAQHERVAPAAQIVAAPAAAPAGVFSPALLWRAALWIWLAGVGLLAARIAAQNILFQRQLRKSRPIEDARIRDLFSQCAKSFGIHFPIRLVATDAIASPALYGWWHPVLLLPEKLLPTFTTAELRNVFFHELAHVKRRDMAVHWVVTVLSVLHWFNPVLWLAFRRMAADRELACDELALSHVGEAQRRGYGETILKVLESCARPAALPGVMGLLEDKDQMIRRITLIARFTPRPRWSALAVAVLVALACATLTDATENSKSAATKGETNSTASATVSTNAPNEDAPETAALRGPRPNLTGQIKTKAGEPLPKATIFIATAGPKVGSSTFCPSCYADCRKDAKSGAQGEFTIASLDPQLLFRILVAAPGYKPKYVAKVDPTNGPVTVTLDPLERTEAAPDRSVRGRIVDTAGKPVYGAVVEAHGIRKKNDIGTMWGTLPGVDPLAVTDEKGEFLLTAKDPFESLDLRVSARAFANKSFNRVASGTNIHSLAITEGASITGRVVHDGKPLAGVSVGVVSTRRDMENYTGNFEVATDKNGKFAFVNLPPNVTYQIYGLMASVKRYGSIPSRTIQAGADGESLDAGDLPIMPAQKLAGQVVLSDGKPIPARTRLLLSREGAWDSLQLELDKDGRFETTGLAQETVSLSVNVKGYRLSARNRSLDSLNPYELVGRIEGDTTNLVIQLEPGKDVEPDYSAVEPDSSQPRNHALHGIEGAVEHADDFVLSGSVRDKTTGEALENFQVTAGNQGPLYQGPYWDKRNSTRGSNGLFRVYLSKKFNEPLLKLESEGYLPRSISILPEARTNLDFTLEKGAGPSGVVLLPDGKPAQGVSVALLCARQQDVRLNTEGRLRAFRNKGAIQLTDPDGAFSFAPELEMQRVVVAAREGFKRVTVEELAKDSRLTLEPWAKLKGVIYRDLVPATNETLDLGFTNSMDYFLEIHATTDAAGRFEFDLVPPGTLQIKMRHMLNGGPTGGWTTETVETAVIKPGETKQVEIHAQSKARTRIISTEEPEPKPLATSGPPIEGSIVLPDGTPVAGMNVALKVPGKYLSVERGALNTREAQRNGLAGRTDEKGHFSLPRVATATGIATANERGIAQADLLTIKTNSKIVLQPWGRIEGTLKVRGAPGTNQMVALSPLLPQQSDLTLDFQAFRTKTDESGRFILTDVPPGIWSLARLIPMPREENSWMHSSGTLVEVKPRETTKLQVGGAGRTILGKVSLKNGPGSADPQIASGVMRLPLPSGYPKQSGDMIARETAMREWSRTAEGRAYLSQVYPVQIDKSGNLRIDDALPGKYELTILFYAGNPSPQEAPQMLGALQREVIVPEPKDSNDHADVDLGPLGDKVEPVTPGFLKSLNRGAL